MRTDQSTEIGTRRRRLLLAGAAMGAAVAGHMLANAYRFAVDVVDFRIPRLTDRLRVALLCDLHYGPYMRIGSVAAWIDATIAYEPDLVILGGDMVDGLARADVTPLTRQIARLRAPLGVYAVWGNHDRTRFRDLGPFTQALEEAGVTVLVNRGLLVRDDLFLAGIDDPSRGTPDAAEAVRERPPGSACLLVAHNPDALEHVPESVDLTLCGHTHGGQIQVPGLGRLVKSSRYAQRFARGWVRRGALGYVSRGLGVGVVPLRLNCPPELTVLDLRP